GSLDKTARLWDLNTGAELDVIRNRYEPVSAVAFSPDGSRLIISSDTNTVLDTAPLPKDYGDLVKAGKKLAPRCLTKEQHEEFHVSSPPWMTPPWCEASGMWPHDTASAVAEQLESAKKHMSYRQYDKAIAAVERAVALDPKSDSQIDYGELARAHN